MAASKIATCCYCGTRAVLVLRGKDRHELSCATCGAPLHAMKMLPQSGAGGSAGPGGVRGTAPAATPPRPATSASPARHERERPRRPAKRKKRKNFGRKIWSEVWDALEEIFD